MPIANKVIIKEEFTHNSPQNVVDYLAERSSVSKMQIKKAMQNGALRIRKKGQRKLARTRRAKTELRTNDYVEFYFDQRINDSSPEVTPHCLYQNRNYSIWFKPTGHLSQGNNYGDHWSILRFVEKEKGETYLIHRLDKEVSGIMLFAHNKKNAQAFSKMFQEQKIKKEYRAIVLGTVDGEKNKTYSISKKLDGKKAQTNYQIINTLEQTTELSVEISSGRLHQIRRHMESIGHPIMGDPKYGKNNKNKEGIKLVAAKLSFIDPFSKKEMSFSLSESELYDCLGNS